MFSAQFSVANFVASVASSEQLVPQRCEPTRRSHQMAPTDLLPDWRIEGVALYEVSDLVSHLGGHILRCLLCVSYRVSHLTLHLSNFLLRARRHFSQFK